MNRCENCDHWGVADDTHLDYRECTRLESDVNVESDRTDHDAVVAAAESEVEVGVIRRELAVLSGNWCWLRTRAAFGCVLWEPK